jgi:hypothetical protein
VAGEIREAEREIDPVQKNPEGVYVVKCHGIYALLFWGILWLLVCH